MGTCVRMTHPVDVVANALELSAGGKSATEVARLIAVPRATVRDWTVGKLPRRNRLGVVPGCDRCGDVHDVARHAPDYAYLLGMYLGDGCLSPHPRGVFKLRVSLDARYPGIVEECEDAVRALMPAVA